MPLILEANVEISWDRTSSLLAWNDLVGLSMNFTLPSNPNLGYHQVSNQKPMSLVLYCIHSSISTFFFFFPPYIEPPGLRLNLSFLFPKAPEETLLFTPIECLFLMSLRQRLPLLPQIMTRSGKPSQRGRPSDPRKTRLFGSPGSRSVEFFTYASNS